MRKFFANHFEAIALGAALGVCQIDLMGWRFWVIFLTGMVSSVIAQMAREGL